MIKIQNQKSRSNKESCCGCGACAAVCPNNCIEMKEDEEGFLYPEVNAERCVQCERCTRSCPCEKSNQDQGYSKNGLKKQFPLAYGGWHTDEAILGQSSSGGAFSLFAERIIEMGGWFTDALSIRKRRYFIKVYAARRSCSACVSQNMFKVHWGMFLKK